MTIKEVLKKYNKIEIELLLAHVLRKPREFLFLFPQHELTRIQHSRLTRIARRRLRGEPIAYILGYKGFYGLKFKVNKNVLIPRPETEMVVDLVSAKLRSSPPMGEMPSAAEAERVQSYGKQPLPGPLLTASTSLGVTLSCAERVKRRGKLRGASIKILDIGTGSGCIVISLAKNLSPSPNPSPSGRGKPQPPLSLWERGRGEGYDFYASDVSSAALKVARQNAKIRGVKVKFFQSDLLNNFKGNFDIIIANLPYLSPDWKYNRAMGSSGLSYEPQQALFAKEKGLMLIRRLLEQIASLKYKPKLVYPAPLLSKKWCWIYLEFDPRQKLPLTKLIKKSLPGSKTKFYKDYGNLWRYVEISLS